MPEMSPKDRRRIVEHILALNLAWVGAADRKVAPTLAIDTAMLGVLAALVPNAHGWITWPAILSALTAVLLLGSILALALATFPRLDGPRNSLLFFAGIAALDRDQYASRLENVDDREVFSDFCAQIHRNAEIASAKFAWVRWSHRLLLAAIIPWLVTISLLYALRLPTAHS